MKNYINFKEHAAKDMELLAQWRNGNESARDELILRQEFKVNSIARKHSKWSNGLDHNDLVQEGWLGVLRAIEKFDEKMGVPFNYYAGLWCTAAMHNSIYQKGRTIRTPAGVARKISKLRQLESLAEQTDAVTTDENLAEQMNINVKSLAKIRQSAVSTCSSDVLMNESGACWITQIESQQTSPDEVLARKDLMYHVKIAIETKLTPKEKLTISEYFAVDDHAPRKTLEEIGGELGLTRQGIRAIRIRALKKIKDYLHSKGECNYV